MATWSKSTSGVFRSDYSNDHHNDTDQVIVYVVVR
jgi:hypothetical protein